MEGGAESGFRHVVPEEYKPRLLRFCGSRKNVEVYEVSCFNLDTLFLFILFIFFFLILKSKNQSYKSNERFIKSIWKLKDKSFVIVILTTHVRLRLCYIYIYVCVSVCDKPTLTMDSTIFCSLFKKDFFRMTMDFSK